MPPSTSPSPSPCPHRRSVPCRLCSSHALVNDKRKTECPRIDSSRRGGDGRESRSSFGAARDEQTNQRRVRARTVSMDEAVERERFRIARTAVRPSPSDIEAWPSKLSSAQPTVGVLSSSASNSLPEGRTLPPSPPLVAVPDAVDTTFNSASSFFDFSPFLDLPPDSAPPSPAFPSSPYSKFSPSPSPSHSPPVSPLDCHHLLDLVECLLPSATTKELAFLSSPKFLSLALADYSSSSPHSAFSPLPSPLYASSSSSSPSPSTVERTTELGVELGESSSRCGASLARTSSIVPALEESKGSRECLRELFGLDFRFEG